MVVVVVVVVVVLVVVVVVVVFVEDVDVGPGLSEVTGVSGLLVGVSGLLVGVSEVSGVVSGSIPVGLGGSGVVISEVSVSQLLSTNVSFSRAVNLTVDNWKSLNCNPSKSHSKASAS